MRVELGKETTNWRKTDHRHHGRLSLLVGAHQFLFHPLMVLVGWVMLYGWWGGGTGKGKGSDWRWGMRGWRWRDVLPAIFLHDLGYLWCHRVDDETGSNHPALGARLAGELRCSISTRKLILSHSRFYSSRSGFGVGKLFWADKLGSALYPSLLWAVMCWLSGEGREYVANQAYEINHGLGRVRVKGESPTVEDLYWFHKRYREWYRGRMRSADHKEGLDGVMGHVVQ